MKPGKLNKSISSFTFSPSEMLGDLNMLAQVLCAHANILLLKTKGEPLD